MSPSPHLATALDVERWADRISSRTDFPRLVRRLIQQTNDQVVSLDMRGGESSDMPGYDGRVQASRATPFVPGGATVWELGVGAGAQAKANSDYRTRTTDSLGVDKTTTTFVFVTARRWDGKTAWAERKRNEAKWADVQAFDADDIEIAFDAAPAAHYWFSELIGLPVDGVQTLESWWDAFSEISQPRLTPSLVLAGRADASALLLQLLEEDTRITTISAPSTDDVLAFVAASLVSGPEPQRGDLTSRALIVYDTVSLRRLDATSDLLVLLPFDEDLRRQALLVRSHHIILIAPQGEVADIELPGVDREVFAADLKAQGVDDEAASKLSRSAHRSLVAFQNDSPARGGTRRDWSSAFASKVVRRAWLAGGWQEARTADTDVLASLLGKSYDDSRDELSVCATGEDPLFAIVGSTWGLISAEQAWASGRSRLNRSDLEKLELAIQTVLASVDPALELPVSERWAAALLGRTRIHSSDLRRGLARTLAVFGAFGRTGPAALDVADWAATVVARLLRRANDDPTGMLWASLSDLLPLLAEATPAVFLQAVRTGVTPNGEPILKSLFLDRKGSETLSVGSPHTGLLRALETVAWSRDHGREAIELLARLAELDPGGRLSNRPLNSLIDIFRPWLPQTSLSAASRLEALDDLRRGHSEVAWHVMLGLLPKYHEVGNYTSSPTFRDWKADESPLTYGAIWEMARALSERMVEDAPSSPERWAELASRVDDLPADSQSMLLQRLRELAVADELSTALRSQIWEALDKVVRQHRKFPEADWSLPSETLDAIGAVAAVLRPPDPSAALAWLFDEQFPDLGEAAVGFDVQQARIDGARSDAAEKVLEIDGPDGLIEMANHVSFPFFLGDAAASHGTDELDERFVPLIDDDERAVWMFAAGYSFGRNRSEGESWLMDHVESARGRPLAQARLLQLSDDLESAWAKVSELGPEVESSYWREFVINGRGHDFQLVNQAAESLLRHDRISSAVDLLSMYAHANDRRVSADLVARTLERLVQLHDEGTEPGPVAAYELNTLLDYLNDETDFDADRLGVLEWRLLPARDYGGHSRALELRLARDPAFFVEIVSLIYRPRGEEPSQEMSAGLAENAWRLLNSWRIVPGSSEPGGEVNGSALDAWVDRARELLADNKRTEVGDISIGNVLAHSGTDGDGTWPTEPIRDLIERLANPDIENGFAIQIFNNRGTTIRGVTDGGGLERTLVEQYSDLADRIRNKWPRTSAVLRSISEDYEREARRQDEDAERFREGMGG